MNKNVFKVSEIQSLFFFHLRPNTDISDATESVYWISHLKSNYFGFISYKCQGIRKRSKTLHWQKGTTPIY